MINNMKILYIDPVCLPGHDIFNRLQISALKKLPCEIHYCVVAGCKERLKFEISDIVYGIPDKLCRLNRGGIIYRMGMYNTFRWIKHNILLNQYDNIIISCYDEIALALAKFPRSYIINHRCKLNHFLKRYCFKIISRKHIHIVLEQYIKDYFIKLGCKNIEVVAHGLIEPYDITPKEIIWMKSYNFLVSSLSVTSIDKSLIRELIHAEPVNEWFKNNNALFFIKGLYDLTNQSNIKISTEWLSVATYQQILLRSDAILICYPPTFRYRVSGILLEAIANHKSVIIRDLPAFEQYRTFLDKSCFFDSVESFIQALDYVKSQQGKRITLENRIKKKFQPDYSFLLNRPKP